MGVEATDALVVYKAIWKHDAKGCAAAADLIFGEKKWRMAEVAKLESGRFADRPGPFKKVTARPAA
jgi:hypothetical protein